MKVAFCDRDGTLIKDYPDEEWRNVKSPEFFPETFETLRQLRQKGYEIIIVTNQYLIDEGFITFEHYSDIARQFLAEVGRNDIEIKAVYFCRHARSANCNCRKPNPGMIEQALRDFPDIELETSFLVGDSESDLGLAQKVGLKSFGINIEVSGYEYTKVGSISGILVHL